jgi:hypothetical protein
MAILSKLVNQELEIGDSKWYLWVGNHYICAQQKILFINETKWYKIWSRPKGWVKKIFQTLPSNFVKGHYKSCLKFHPFCMNESEENEAKGYFMLKKLLFLPRIKIKEIFDAILK